MDLQNGCKTKNLNILTQTFTGKTTNNQNGASAPHFQTIKQKITMQNLLQSLYDQANWYGYAKQKNKIYYPMQIEAIAKRVKVKINYFCLS